MRSPRGYSIGRPDGAYDPPYYRSTYVFVFKAGEPPVSSFDDPSLKTRTIGVQLIGDNGMSSPPAHALAERGIVENVRGFMVYGDYRADHPLSEIVHAVATGEVDVAAVWGPVARYFAAKAEATARGHHDPREIRRRACR